jgi:hypothetical protein
MYSRTAVRTAVALYAGASSRRRAPSQFHMTPDRPRIQLSPNKCETPLKSHALDGKHSAHIVYRAPWPVSLIPHVTMRLWWLTSLLPYPGRPTHLQRLDSLRNGTQCCSNQGTRGDLSGGGSFPPRYVVATTTWAAGRIAVGRLSRAGKTCSVLHPLTPCTQTPLHVVSGSLWSGARLLAAGGFG